MPVNSFLSLLEVDYFEAEAPALGAPVLLTPPDDATGVFTGPLLTWEAVAGATSYEVDVATDSLFSNIVYTQGGIIGTSHQVPAATLTQGLEYFWRARANDD